MVFNKKIMMSKKIYQIFKTNSGVLPEEDSAILFNEIYNLKSEKIKKQIFYTVGESLYEDVLQEVFFKIHKNLNSFNGKSSIDTWIYRLTMNTCYDFLKKENRRFNYNVEDLKTSYTHDHDTKKILKTAILTLSKKQRSVFTLFYILEESILDISQVLNIPEGTVKSRLKISRDLVKEFLIENGVNYE